MLVLAIFLMVIGSFGVGAATFMEIKSHEAKWKIMMKVFPWIFGVGAVLLAIVIAGG
ncbi:unnamed protein product [marine sediment metagenome]|uniref:Uncharacterized protein n=1 Tax=marine sediment metagenome TaxID=412755 RepID=X1S986_9ZZZZ